MSRALYAGVDIGSTTSKCALLDEDGNFLSFYLKYTEVDRNKSGEEALRGALDKIGASREDVKRLVATGYGRYIMEGTDDTSPEIICHAKGTVFLHPTTRCIIDIGGQDSKAIGIDDMGIIEKFEMNDKCAAGTGRFFEVLSNRLLSEDIDVLADISLEADDPCTISSMCTIFAETEIVSLLSEGVSKANIMAGMNQAVARRVYMMAKRCLGTMPNDVVFTGGVAKSEGVRRAMESLVGKPVHTLEHAQSTGCVGAALIALEGQ